MVSLLIILSKYEVYADDAAEVPFSQGSASAGWGGLEGGFIFMSGFSHRDSLDPFWFILGSLCAKWL